MEEQLITVLTYVALGAVYGSAGYVKHVARGERAFDPFKFGRTLLVGAVAGALVAAQGGEFSVGAFEAAMVIAVPAVDQLLNARSGSSARDTETRA